MLRRHGLLTVASVRLLAMAVARCRGSRVTGMTICSTAANGVELIQRQLADRSVRIHCRSVQRHSVFLLKAHGCDANYTAVLNLIREESINNKTS
jgi:hypothetical protein